MTYKIYQLARVLIGMLMVGGVIIHLNDPAQPLPLVFYIVVALVGIVYVLMGSAMALLPDKKRSTGVGEDPKPGSIQVGFVMDSLEDGQESLGNLGKLVTRAIHIRKCKQNTDAEAFEQAARELAEVEAKRAAAG